MSQYPEGIEWIYETWTPRMSRAEGINHVCFIGVQGALAEIVQNFDDHFFNRPLADVIAEHDETIKDIFKKTNPEFARTHGSEHVKALWEKRCLPIKVKALPEGTFVPIGVPMFTIENTDERFFWIPGYIETQLSSYIWSQMTSATIASTFKQLLVKFARLTSDEDKVNIQAGDFSMRGMSSPESAYRTAMGHLLSFDVSATIPVRNYLKAFYQKPTGALDCNPSTEHSVMCSYGLDEVLAFLELTTKKFPSGNISIVSDTYDFWNVISDVLPKVKPQIMNRSGKVFIRPDSGDPVDIVAGKEQPYFDTIEAACIYFNHWIDDRSRKDWKTNEVLFTRIGKEMKWYRHYVNDTTCQCLYEEYEPTVEDMGLCEALWNLFGGIYNDKGYKELDKHIGITYGDAITIDRAYRICKRLADKGFASTNVSLGIGSFTYQYVTRDTFGFALKGTAEIMNGQFKKIQKLVKSDTGNFKKSQKGMVAVVWDNAINDYKLIDDLDPETLENIKDNCLQDFFHNGQFYYLNNFDDIKALVCSETKRVYNL